MRVVPALLAAGLLAGGCASQAREESREERAGGLGPSTVACDDVWQEGKTLPPAYRACLDADGDVELADEARCDDTRPVLTSPDGTLAAFRGGVVVATEDPLSLCR